MTKDKEIEVDYFKDNEPMVINGVEYVIKTQANSYLNAKFTLSPPAVRWPEKLSEEFNTPYIQGWNACLEACKNSVDENTKELWKNLMEVTKRTEGFHDNLVKSQLTKGKV